MLRKLGVALCLLAIAGGLAIAQNSAGNFLTGSAKADVLKHYSGPAVLPKPERILVCDFTVPGADVTTDKSIAGELHRRIMVRDGVNEDSSPQALAHQVQAAFVKSLAGELAKVNIQTVSVPPQKTCSDVSAEAGPVLVVAGEFLAINEGDETKRIMIGLGRGASDIKTHVTVSSVNHDHPTVVLEFNLSSESGKKPGAVATMGVGSLAVGAAAGGVGDRQSTVEADASRMAKLVAKQLDAFMAEQKWIPNTSARAPTGHLANQAGL
jgi:hypothetical protein